MLDSRRQLAAVALTGGPCWGWISNLFAVGGAGGGSLCGAAAYHWINLAAIWLAAAGALALSAIVAVTVHR